MSLGSQKSKQVFENNTVEYVGGTLASNSTIDIEAKSAADTKGSIKALAVGAGVGSAISVGTDLAKPVIVNVVEDKVDSIKSKIEESADNNGGK